MYKIAKKLRLRKLNLRQSIVIFMLLFGVLGAILLITTKAIAPTTHFEAENSTLSEGAVVGTDAQASSGQFAQFNASSSDPTPPEDPPATGSRTCPAYPAMPDASCTGVPPGVTLTPSGSITVTQDGAVISGLLVDGDITVLADNVTIKNSKIVGGRIAAGYGTEQTGLVVMDVEFDGNGEMSGWSAIGDVNYTCIRCHIYGVGNGPRAGGNVIIEDSYVHGLCCYAEGDHRTAFGSNGGSNITLRHNYLDCNIGGCSASTSFYSQWESNNILVEKNLFNTKDGVFCLYAGDEDLTNGRFLDNIFGQKYNPTCGSGGAVASRAPGLVWMGNKFENGTPIN